MWEIRKYLHMNLIPAGELIAWCDLIFSLYGTSIYTVLVQKRNTSIGKYDEEFNKFKESKCWFIIYALSQFYSLFCCCFILLTYLFVLIAFNATKSSNKSTESNIAPVNRLWYYWNNYCCTIINRSIRGNRFK